MILKNDKRIAMNTEFLEQKLRDKNLLFDALRLKNKKRGGVRDVVKKHTEWVDYIIKEYFSTLNLNKQELCVVALGGYGRRQLNLYSDIDIMILSESVFDVSIINNLYDIFYHLQYSCSISTRSISECAELSKEDDTIKTSLYDSRFLYGSSSLFKKYSGVLAEKIIRNEPQKFIDAKLEYMEARYKKYGSTIFVLEPNIKEGVGSLRDYHTMLWVGKTLFLTKNMMDMKKKGIISQEDYVHLKNALHFLWQLRNALHFVTSKETDILHLDLRAKVANEIGYESSGKFDAQERLMRKYYYHARYMERGVKKYLQLFLNKDTKNVKSFFINSYIVKKGETISFKDGELDVEKVFYLFYYAAVYDAKISIETLENMKRAVNSGIRRNRKNAAVAFIFREILSLKKPIEKTIRMMHEIGLIDKYIPEFGNICCLSEYSLYHKYTVDEHSIQALGHLDSLYNFDVPKTFLTRLSYLWRHLNPHERFILRLAVLLHDVGKIEKQHHESVGAKLSKTISKRLGIGKDLELMLYFLIKNHLLINRTVSGRDIEDPKTLNDFTDVIKSKNNLILLNLLNYADMKAVNDNVWTSWRESIIESLYLQSTFYFEDKNYDEFLKINAKESKRRIKTILGSSYEPIIEEFPDSIFKDIDTENAAKYIRDIRDTKRNVFIYKTGKGIDKLLVYYKNEFGLFHKISGVLACFNVNIISAKSYDLKNGMIMDIFDVNLPSDYSADSIKIERMLNDANKGAVDLNECVLARKNVFLSRTEKAKLEISLMNIDVYVDNSLSDLYTVIIIKAPDRIGLVYDVTKVFLKFRLYVGMFIIDTKGAVAVDTFYVADEHFRKIYSDKLIDLIKSSLFEVLS